MTHQANRFPLPMSVLAVVVVAALTACASGVAFGFLIGKTVGLDAGMVDARGGKV
jgi:hypothetical protein